MGWGGILTSFLLNTMCNYVFIFSITFLLRCWFIHTLLTVQLRCDLLDQVPTTLSIKFQVHRWFFSHHLQLCCYHVIKFLLLLTAVTQLTATFLTKTCVTTCNDVVIVSAKFQLRCWFFSHHLQLRCDLLDQVPTTLLTLATQLATTLFSLCHNLQLRCYLLDQVPTTLLVLLTPLATTLWPSRSSSNHVVHQVPSASLVPHNFVWGSCFWFCIPGSFSSSSRLLTHSHYHNFTHTNLTYNNFTLP